MPPSLIYENADLSQCHSKDIPNNFEDLLNAEASLPFIHNTPDASSEDNEEDTPLDHCFAIQSENPLYEPVDSKGMHVDSSRWHNQQPMINHNSTKTCRLVEYAGKEHSISFHMSGAQINRDK